MFACLVKYQCRGKGLDGMSEHSEVITNSPCTAICEIWTKTDQHFMASVTLFLMGWNRQRSDFFQRTVLKFDIEPANSLRLNMVLCRKNGTSINGKYSWFREWFNVTEILYMYQLVILHVHHCSSCLMRARKLNCYRCCACNMTTVPTFRSFRPLGCVVTPFYWFMPVFHAIMFLSPTIRLYWDMCECICSMFVCAKL